MNPLQPWLDNKNLSEKLYKALQWPPAVYNRPDFPFVIAGITYVQTADGSAAGIDIALRFKEECSDELHLQDPAQGFPSQELLAQLNVLAGSAPGRWRAQHRREVQKRVERERQRSKYSSRPW